MTIAHLRTYTINQGMLDSWLKTFPKLIPVMEEAGIKVEGSWVNDAKSQFIWIRSYGDDVANNLVLPVSSSETEQHPPAQAPRRRIFTRPAVLGGKKNNATPASRQTSSNGAAAVVSQSTTSAATSPVPASNVSFSDAAGQ